MKVKMNIKKLINNNKKLLLGLIIGLTLSASVVYATTYFASDEVSYNDTKVTGTLGASTVEGALNALNTRMEDSCRPKTVTINVVNGTITGESTKEISAGETGTFTVNPNAGYEFEEASCTNNQTAILSGSTLSITPTSDTTCTVNYKLLTLKVGDYVTVVPDKSTYTITTSLTGYSSAQTITPNELTLWRIININDDGTYDAVSEYVSSTNVYFMGVTGYANFVGGLQTIAAQYAKSGITVGTRMMGYNGQTLTISNTSAFDGSSTTLPSTTRTPWGWSVTEQLEYDGGVLGDTLYFKDLSLVKNIYAKDNNSANYGVGVGAYQVGTTTLGTYWLTSRIYDYNSSSGSAKFSVLVTNRGNSLNAWELRLFGYEYNYSEYARVRPIITIASSVSISGGSGTKDSPYTVS